MRTVHHMATAPHVLLSRLLFGEQRLNPTVVWVLTLAIASGVGILTVKLGLLVAAAIILLVIAAPIALSALWNTQIGLYIMVFFAYFLGVFNRLLRNVPLGIALDCMILIMLLGLLYRCYRHKDWSPFTSPISVAVGLWAAMNVIELFNPIAGSRMAWFYVIRPAVGYLLLFFLTLSALKDEKQLYSLLFTLIAVNTISAFWGIYQYFFGYFDWEMAHIMRNDALHLVFNDGRWRSFGSVGSPAQYGILMAFTGSISMMMIGGFRSLWIKGLLFIAGSSALLALLYSGTRSAFVIPGIFFIAWVVLSGKKRWYASLLVPIIGLVVLANVQTSNYQLQRIQTIFNATQDKSYQVRAQNRAMITPWIIMHPIGGGLGSTGVWGTRFSPHTFLANFPPDSGLVRVAVELGWIGLILFLNVYGQTIWRAAKAYRKMHNRKLRVVTAGITCGVAALLPVEWGQEVVGVYPISILFWLYTAILFRAIALDQFTTQNINS
ncbi:MAG: O-antigen ligase family protein [Cyclobacteriaceae bacterium]